MMGAVMNKPRIFGTVEFATKAQKERIEKAARSRKWSRNKFILDAAEKEAVKILTGIEGSEQLTVAPERLSLNQ